VGGNSEMEGRGAGLWVGKSSDLCCEACRELRVWFRFGFGRHFGDVSDLSFLSGKGPEVVMERKTSGIYVL
jgi:hypothetical protein